jgi:hypothetical protein
MEVDKNMPSKKKKFGLIDAQDSNKLELHVAFLGNDYEDQIVCELPESVVLSLVKSYYWKNDFGYTLPVKDFEIDSDVLSFIKKKYSL